MKIARILVAMSVALALCATSAFSQKQLGFESETEQWWELSVSGGWGIYQSAVNHINVNGGSPFLFDDGSDNGGSFRAELGWGTSENFMLGFGLWYARGSDDAVSPEVADPLYEPAPSDEFLYFRSVTHTLVAPYLTARYFFKNDGHMRYFFSGGTMLGVSRATFRFNTEDLLSGELRGERDIGDTQVGLFGSIGLRRVLSSSLSFGAEVGYRHVDEMKLDQGDVLIVSPPFGPEALLISSRLNADYSGPFAMVSFVARL